MSAAQESLYTENGEYIFTVDELNRSAATALESQFKLIFVTGELSNLSRPASGHIYFSLKDKQAQIRCAWFRGRQTPLAFQLENGLAIIVLAEVTIYPDRGDYQLVIKKIFLTGSGVIQQELEALKRKLNAEGLFSLEFKKPLPHLPKRIGIITSITGAALQDVLAVLKRRAPFIPITVYPCQVQGKEAPDTLLKAIHQANHDPMPCSVLILTRGGGSNEDLWAFNHAELAYAIFKSVLPIVSAVGHEIDLTISDLVADHRAPTPSAAAELVSPNIEDLLIHFMQYQRRLHQSLTRILQNKRQVLDQKARLIKHPREKFMEQGQILRFKESELNKIIHKTLLAKKNALQRLDYAIQKSTPLQHIEALKNQLNALRTSNYKGIKNTLSVKKNNFTILVEKIQTLSPINILTRGYSILYTDKNKVLSHAEMASPGQTISADLIDGRLICHLEKIILCTKSTQNF